MFKRSMHKVMIAIFFGLFLSGCESTSTGAVSIGGVPSKVQIRENAPSGVLVDGMDIIINNEFIGTAKRIGRTSASGMNSAVAFEPIPSKYGEVRIVQNIGGTITGVNINFDVFVAGSYAGNVQMASAI